jgi:hypothetical protein
MEGKHFDQVIKRMGTGVGRRHVLGGVIGATAALLTGSAAIKAKKGGNGKGKGKPKVSYCHQTGNGSYRFVTVGAPSGHSKHEGDILCTPPAACQVATGCSDDPLAPACTFEQAEEGTECVDALGAKGTCDDAGTCVVSTPAP